MEIFCSLKDVMYYLHYAPLVMVVTLNVYQNSIDVDLLLCCSYKYYVGES